MDPPAISHIWSLVDQMCGIAGGFPFQAVRLTGAALISVRVMTLANATGYQVPDVAQTATVATFKELLSPVCGVPVGRQRLIFRGRVCRDSQTLAALHVNDRDTLHLVDRPEGSSPLLRPQAVGRSAPVPPTGHRSPPCRGGTLGTSGRGTPLHVNLT